MGKFAAKVYMPVYEYLYLNLSGTLALFAQTVELVKHNNGLVVNLMHQFYRVLGNLAFFLRRNDPCVGVGYARPL